MALRGCGQRRGGRSGRGNAFLVSRRRAGAVALARTIAIGTAAAAAVAATARSADAAARPATAAARGAAAIAPAGGAAGIAPAGGAAAGGASPITGAAAIPAGSSTAAGGRVSGIATHYTLGDEGNCSYPSPPANGLFAAMSPAEYAGGAACGEYVDITGPRGSVRAEVTDQCPECARGHIDLSRAAFAGVAPPTGLAKVTYQAVTSPPLTAPVAIRVKEGSSPYWLALLPMNTGNPLSSVQVQGPSQGWLPLTRSDYGYWIAQRGAGPGPFTARLTDTAGHTVTVGGITLSPGTVHDTGTRMYTGA